MVERNLAILALEVACSIGIYEHERKAKQRVLIDVEVRLDALAEPRGDSVTEALNYDEIRQTVIDIASTGHFDLQETLARQIFDAVLALPTITHVKIRTQKPDAYADCGTVAYCLSNMGE